MKNILLLNSSPRGDASHSGKVANELVAQLKAKTKGVAVISRDLTTDGGGFRPDGGPAARAG